MQVNWAEWLYFYIIIIITLAIIYYIFLYFIILYHTDRYISNTSRTKYGGAMLGDPGVLLSIEHTVYPCMNVKTREKGCFGRMRVKWGGGY